jgi:hypothetical protein
MPFTRRGEKRPPNAGRRAGTPNKFTMVVKDFLRDLVDDPDVQEAVRQQIITGKPGAIQGFLGAVHQVLGKPKEHVEVESPTCPA